MTTVQQTLRSLVESPKLLDAWRLMEKITREDRRYGLRTWLFVHEMIQAAERVMKEAES